ncbi:putative bifunctional diguanylate cyclase/phosphodiesterase [Mesorhizobium xinjiangense]|uniref:putative bifunctional diguanylate cyclase/phosphodiesterase n=1 Tax=Mesorhizobium xinjiangense TaxID=2678685 RepID=UPI0012EEB426|nr:EAL domain-containing protein [Mesorhizobium xinjiangense]
MKSSKDSIPEDIYVGFVRSLFVDPGILLIGACCHGLIGLLVYLKTGEPIYLLLAVVMLGAGVYRFAAVRRVDPSSISDQASAAARERYYIAAGTIQGCVVGLFALVSVYWLPDPFSEMAAVSVIMGGAITIAGRNYGSRTMVAILTATAVAPIAIGLMLKGDVYHFVLGLFIVPFLIVVMKMASLVRLVLFTALREEKKATRLAQRFDKALNTMSHGLIMLDGEGRIVVANAQAARIMRLNAPEAMSGRTLKALLMRAVAAGMLGREDCAYVEDQLTRALRENCDRKLLVRFADGSHFEFSAREGSDELGVITFEDVTQRVEAEEKIRTMARYDSLTGLPNRNYFHELVTERMVAGDRERLCAVAILDVDDFKNINDTLGHPVGDGLIYAISERLAFFADDDVRIGRFGGDEFIIYVDRIEDESHLAELLDGVFAGLREEMDVAGHALRVQFSAGTVLLPASLSNVDSMIVKADLALHRAKTLGKNGWQLFETTMDAAFRHKQLLKADLRQAVETNALRVVFQPIVSLDTMRVASCEALCRWDHPELGAISPSVFVPLAEEIGIVSDISAQILRTACKECARWPESICVSVNLSARDFGDADVVRLVRDAVAESGLAPDRLEIEVTETALLDDKLSTRHHLEEIRALGVRIALDDFGTGYSSLSYLHTLPLDKVKIDRSFLVDITGNQRSLELLKGVVSLSRQLGLDVTVEGIETFEQLKLLAVHVRPDLLQGFLFGSALSPSGIGTMSNTVWPFGEDLENARRSAHG